MDWSQRLAGVGSMVGGAGQAAGGLGQIYGTYRGAELAEKQYQEDKRRYEDELQRMRMMDALTQQQLNLSNLGQFSQLAGQQQDRIANKYGSYNRMIGR